MVYYVIPKIKKTSIYSNNVYRSLHSIYIITIFAQQLKYGLI